MKETKGTIIASAITTAVCLSRQRFRGAGGATRSTYCVSVDGEGDGIDKTARAVAGAGDLASDAISSASRSTAGSGSTSNVSRTTR
jgi:hypothetical protein